MSTPVTTATFDDTGGQVYVDPKLPTLIINQSATVTVTLSPTQSFDAIQSGQTVAGTQQVMLLQPLAAVTWSPGTPCYAKTPAGTTANITSVPGGMSYYGASTVISGTTDVTITNTPDVVVNGGVEVNSGVINISGGQLATSGGIALQPTSEQLNPSWLGDGSDGAVTISGTVSLTRDMQYSSLSVPSGTVLNTNGYRIRCTGSVTVDGVIANNGQNAAAGVGGAGAPQGTLPGGGSGGYGAAGANASPCLYGGGGGGEASDPSTGTTSAGGNGGSATPTPSIFPTIGQLTNGSAGGGGGGGGDSSGSGGGGAGPILIICQSIAGSGSIQTIGGNGNANGSYSGGGGGGGIAIIACFTNTFTGTLQYGGGVGQAVSPYTATNGQEGFAYILDGMQW